jgi:UDP-N-acetylmuramoyl-tripeptide--D-alanyl-D-alanine ligase
MAKLTPEFVYEKLGFSALARRTLSGGIAPFTNVTTDSRKVEAGCLFVAISGDNFDGHEFIPQAIQKGARGILCRKGTDITPQKDLSIFAVDDVLVAYRRLASAWRREFSIPVIAVAGAVGKTTTKELLSACLRGRWPKVHRTQGSQNGFVGIPMSLFEIRPEHGAAVIEVGIDEIGAMESHMPLVAATASLLTAIAPEHLEKLIDLPTVAREEGIALQTVAASGGLVAINLDDPWIRPHFTTLRQGRKIGYTMTGYQPGAQPGTPVLSGRIANDPNVASGAEYLEVTGIANGGDTSGLVEIFTLPLPGRHNAGNLLAAIAIAHGLGLSADEMRKGLATFAGAEGRSELRELAGGTPVVCDYYNASPASMEAGFQMLTDVAQSRSCPSRWACLGDMLELGKGEVDFHRGLAESIVRLGIEHVLLYGPRMQSLNEELQTRGFRGTLSHHATHEELARKLLEQARPGEAILIKGSRGMKMEESWKVIQSAWPNQSDAGHSPSSDLRV